MTAVQVTVVVLALLVAASAAAGLGWGRRRQSLTAVSSGLLLAAAALVAAIAGRIDHGRLATTAVVTVAGLLAAVGGGPVTTWIFSLVDRSATDDTDLGRLLERAGEVLRGGAWIGVLERLAVFAGLAAGFPEGVAVVLALKGVGRYPDLRDAGRTGSGTTERFIIGTFTSVLWAAACAGVVALVRR